MKENHLKGNTIKLKYLILHNFKLEALKIET